jgi:hypothetical protein
VLGFLESELCDEAQGYLLGKPADIESYRRLTHEGEAIDERPAVNQEEPYFTCGKIKKNAPPAHPGSGRSFRLCNSSIFEQDRRFQKLRARGPR